MLYPTCKKPPTRSVVKLEECFTSVKNMQRYFKKRNAHTSACFVFWHEIKNCQFLHCVCNSSLGLGFRVVNQDHWGKPLINKLANFYTQGFFIFPQEFLIGNRVFLKVTLVFGHPFTPYVLFDWCPLWLRSLQSNEILLNLGMKWWKMSVFNAQGSRVITIVRPPHHTEITSLSLS